jgi:hypothetical protein
MSGPRKVVAEECPFHDVVIPRPSSADVELAGRVSKLEGALETVINEVSEVSRQVASVNNTVNEVVGKLGSEIGSLRQDFASQLSGYSQRTNDAMERTADKARAAAAPNLTAIIGIVATVIAILGLGVTLLISHLSNHATEIAALKLKNDEYQKNFADLEYKRGGSDATQRFNTDQIIANSLRFKDLDDKSQNDAKMIQATADAKIASVEAKADAKIASVEAKFDAKLKPMDEYLADFLKWRLAYVSETAEFRGRVTSLLDEVNSHTNKVSDRLWQDHYDKLKVYEGQDIQDLNGLRKNEQPKKAGP